MNNSVALINESTATCEYLFNFECVIHSSIKRSNLMSVKVDS